jgi:hypothetical protein
MGILIAVSEIHCLLRCLLTGAPRFRADPLILINAWPCCLHSMALSRAMLALDKGKTETSRMDYVVVVIGFGWAVYRALPCS